MVAWKDMTRTQRRTAEATFAALSSVDSLLDRDESDGGAIGFADLRAFVSAAPGLRDQDVRLALMRDPRLRRDLDRLLAKTAVVHFPRAAAASSGDVEVREGEGFRLRIRRSQAVSGQCYVIIEMEPEGLPMPTALFVKTAAGALDKHLLPDAQDRVIQLLVDEESDLVAGLRDPHTEVYLR